MQGWNMGSKFYMPYMFWRRNAYKGVLRPNIFPHRECYCGDSLPAGAAALSESNCNMLCSGNKREFCGAGSKLDIYSNVS
jgi:WSC domain